MEKTAASCGHPKVTVITVVRNNVATIERCIHSVHAQTYGNMEHIVIDGQSTDGTVEAIRRHLDHIDVFISEPDQGIYDAMNKGLSLATGEYIAFLNSDDYYVRDAVKASIFHILQNDLDISYAGFVYQGKNGLAVMADESRPWNDSMLVQGMPGGHETIFAHRRCYDAVGGFDLSYKLAADYDWVMRAYKAGFRAEGLAKNILIMAEGGASYNEDLELEENYRLLRKHFGNLDQDTLDRIYQLKYYKNWFGSALNDQGLLEIYGRLPQGADALRKAVALSIENRKRPLTGVVQPDDAPEEGRLKIAIALTFLTDIAGGAERIAIETANALAARGHAVTVVCCHGATGEPYYPLDPSIPYIDLAINPYKLHYERLGSELVLDYDQWCNETFEELDYTPTPEDFDRWQGNGHLWRTRMYHAFFSQHHFDLVVSHMPSTFPYVLLGRSQHDRTVHIASLHNAPAYKFYSDLYPAEGAIDRHMRLASLKKADFISLLFDEFTSQMPSSLQDKCFTLPNFTEQNVEVPPPSDKGRRIIVSVGRFVPQKDHATLLRAYRHVRDRHPDWALHLYGAGPLEDELRALCRKLELDPAEIFRGQRRDIATAYAEADICAFPSLYEGFGLVVAEAMRAGVPTVAFEDCEGVRYLIRHEEDGLLTSREAGPQGFAAAITRLIEDDGLRHRLGRAAVTTAKRYAVDEAANILESMATPRPAHSGNPAATEVRNPLRTAVVTAYLEGGAGAAAKRLHKALTLQGHESRVLTFSKPAEPEVFETALKEPELNLLRSYAPLYDDMNRLPGSTIFSANCSGIGARQLAFLDTFDVINLHWVAQILSNEAIAQLARSGKPIVWTLHDMNAFTGGCHYSHGCEGYKYDCLDCPQLLDTFGNYPARMLAAKRRYWNKNIVLVTPSNWLANCVRESTLFKENRVEVIPNSIDTGIFTPMDQLEARKKLSLPADHKILLFTCQSHAERRKGFNELLEVSNLLREQPEQYHVVTLGRASNDLRNVGLPYTSLGYVEDEVELATIYSAADATVLPTLEDNLPNTILESAACGTPIVAFDSGGVRDAVVDGVTGYLVPTFDCAAMALKIQQAVHEEFGMRCRGHALEHFPLSVQGSRYQALFEELIQRDFTPSGEPAPPIFGEVADTHVSLLTNRLAAQKHEADAISVELRSFQERVRNAEKERDTVAAQLVRARQEHDAALQERRRIETQAAAAAWRHDGERAALAALCDVQVMTSQAEQERRDTENRQLKSELTLARERNEQLLGIIKAFRNKGKRGLRPNTAAAWLRGKVLSSRTRSDAERIRQSDYFDEEWYCHANPDIDPARSDPAIHYLLHGWREGRQPSPHFDGKLYLREHRDVAEANVNPLLHYLKEGAKEGRRVPGAAAGSAT